MTSRERWTVYPLLFLSLGLAVRAIVVPTGEFLSARVESLECGVLSTQEIVVVGPDREVLVHIGREAEGDTNKATAGGGRIELLDRDGRLVGWLGGTGGGTSAGNSEGDASAGDELAESASAGEAGQQSDAEDEKQGQPQSSETE